MVLLFLEELWLCWWKGGKPKPKEGSVGHFLVPKDPDFQNEFKL